MDTDKSLPAATDREEIAGNGLLHRRVFLKGAALASGSLITGGVLAGSTLTTPAWMKTPGAGFTNYGQPSPHEGVVRLISNNLDVPTNGVSWTPLQSLAGTITPTGLHFERHHNGVPQIVPAEHRLYLHGMVRQPLEFTLDKLSRYPLVSKFLFIECGGNSNAGWRAEPAQTSAGNTHGLVSCSEWSGVPLAILLEEAGIDPQASWIVAEAADAFAMNISLPVSKAMDDAFLALYQNGERIRPENGYPLRLILPGWEGVLNVKWLRRLQVASQPVMARNETSKYTELLPDGTARQFTFVMEAKSLITAPSHGMTLAEQGYYEVTGLAWSGRGRIKKVEVSADGGQSWAEAALNEPVLPYCFTRFRAGWHWRGGRAILQSRAIDETGTVQPARAQLVAERGRNGYFHYNAIVSWEVDTDGQVRHVYA